MIVTVLVSSVAAEAAEDDRLGPDAYQLHVQCTSTLNSEYMITMQMQLVHVVRREPGFVVRSPRSLDAADLACLLRAYFNPETRRRA